MEPKSFKVHLTDIQHHRKVADSIRLLRAALNRHPNCSDLVEQLNVYMQIVCDWKDYGGRMKPLSDLIDRNLRANLRPPVDLHSATCLFPLSLQQQLGVATYFSKLQIPRSLPTLQTYQCGSDRLRIGYLFTGAQTFPLLGNRSRHNLDRVEIFCYSVASDPTLVYEMGVPVETLVDISTHDSRGVANRIKADGIHILVNLGGFFDDCIGLNALFSLKPAPIQVVYRSVHGTTGASYIDYLITDKVAVPMEFASGYSEKLAYMPNGMFVCDNRELLKRPDETSEEGAILRRRFGLPPTALVFGVRSDCHNIDPGIFECWCEILRRVSCSVIWFPPYADEVQKNLKRTARGHRVNPSRLIFATVAMVNSQESIDADNLVDIILDTPMCNGVRLMYQMCRGIPVVTLPMESIPSRLTASMLTSIGCEELIAKSKWWYTEMAVNMGNKPELLKEMKDRMWENLPDSNLFRVDQYFNDLENLYQKMWDRRRVALPADHIE